MSAPRQSRRSNRTILSETPPHRQITASRPTPGSPQRLAGWAGPYDVGESMSQFPPPGPPPGQQWGPPAGPPPPGAPVGHPAYGPPPWPPGPPVHQPGVVPLRPLNLGDLFGGATLTIRRNPGATVGLAALVTLAFMSVPIVVPLVLGLTDSLPSLDLGSGS